MSNGLVVTVMHEDGGAHVYRFSATAGNYYPVGSNFDLLEKNDDGSWNETVWETGLRYHYPAGNAVSVAYRQTPQGAPPDLPV